MVTLGRRTVAFYDDEDYEDASEGDGDVDGDGDGDSDGDSDGDGDGDDSVSREDIKKKLYAFSSWPFQKMTKLMRGATEIGVIKRGWRRR